MESQAQGPLLKQRWALQQESWVVLVRQASQRVRGMLASVEKEVVGTGLGLWSAWMAVLELLMVLTPSGRHHHGFPRPVVGSRQSNV